MAVAEMTQVDWTVAVTVNVVGTGVDAEEDVGARPNVRNPTTAARNAYLIAFECFMAM
jgi:hypothetical protein